MRDWDAFVRARLRLPGLAPVREDRIVKELAAQLQDFRVDIRHRVTGRLAATLSYVYEPYRIYDFAFDASVINSIVQPSSLVLGYTYRPYTAHTAVFGILYYW